MICKLLILGLFTGAFFSMQVQALESNAKESSMIKVTSSAFGQNQPIPKKYTCDGENISPTLAFEQLPENTKTIAIVVDDPDAPTGVFDHWVAWNIPGGTKLLQEGARLEHQGVNHFGEIRYKGPCPPPGKPHHYHFKVYALDSELNIEDGSTKEELEAAMKGHILAQGELIGIFQR